MKLFIYYSLTGNGKKIAEILKEKEYEIREVQVIRSLPRNMFLKMMLGGMLGGLNNKAKLVNYDNDVKKYDEIVIGSPILNGKVAYPINIVLAKTDLKGKKISFILYSEGGSAPKAVNKLKSLDDCKIVEVREPKKNDKLEEILEDF